MKKNGRNLDLRPDHHPSQFILTVRQAKIIPAMLKTSGDRDRLCRNPPRLHPSIYRDFRGSFDRSVKYQTGESHGPLRIRRDTVLEQPG